MFKAYEEKQMFSTAILLFTDHYLGLMTTDVKSVEPEGEYYHVRFRDPDNFDTIRTPDWAENPAESVSEGAEVRMGQEKDSDDWDVQSVLIKKSAGDEDKAREQAKEIAEKIED